MPDSEAEKRHFDLLRKHVRIPASYRVYRPDPPDFLVHFSNKIIGIEHTKVFLEKEYPLQAQESIEDDISNIAEQYADANGFIPTRTKILFGATKGLKKSERAIVAHAAADLVQSEILLSNPKPYEQIQINTHMNEIGTIYSTVMPKDFENHYFAARAGWVKRDATTEVYSAVKHKSKKLPNYKKDSDETWLLVVAEGTNPSSLLGKTEGVKPIHSLHGFNRVFFMFYASGFVQEVETA